MESRHWHRHWVTCPHSRGLLLAGRFDFLAGYLARGSVSEGERRGSVLLAALLVLTRRLLSAGRGTRGMGEWKRADLNRGPRGSSVALGGARSLLGELRGSSVALGRATSGGARSPPGELGRFALCGFLAPGGCATALSSLYNNFFLSFSRTSRSPFSSLWPRVTPGTRQRVK